MKIAIIGFDIDGRVAYDYYSSRPEHHTVTIHDQKTELDIPEGAEAVLGETYLDDLDRYDMIVRTSGMHPRKILDKNPQPSVRGKITTQVNEVIKTAPTRNIIGITGTKGKGTTSTLIHDMLEASGKDVYLGGNIGLPPLSFMDELSADSWVILELSSFQLIDLQNAPHLAVCLMVVPEHLDWHVDLEEYLTAKEQLFARQVNGDVAVYFHDNANSKRIASAGQAMKIPYYHSPGAEVIDGKIIIDGTEICRTEEVKLLGQHNWQNVCAAVTAVWYAALEVCGPSDRPDVTAIRQVLASFTGLEHRLEFVRELDGVKYYDDSFGTAPETAIVAIQAFQQPVVLILGGSDKGANYDKLAQEVVRNKVRHVLLIGNQAQRIQAALEQAGYTDFSAGGRTMTEIVDNLRRHSQPGDVALLSTACASFDMFENYKVRGSQFKRAVKDLPSATTAV